MFRQFSSTDSSMWIKIGVGFALMGLSVPGRWLAKFLGPISFIAGLEVIAWAVFTPHWFPAAGVAILLAAVLVAWIEKRQNRREVETAKESSSAATTATTSTRMRSGPHPSNPSDRSREPIFDAAPPEIADVSPASLEELFAGRTEAQAGKLAEQHVGKEVRLSGAVEAVRLGRVPSIVLRTRTDMAVLTFFDSTEGYDPQPVLLALNLGDEITVSGRIFKLETPVVNLDHCKLLDARSGGVS